MISSRNRDGHDGNSAHASINYGLEQIYFTKVKPCESFYQYDRFATPPLTRSEISAKPIVLLVGQYSTGKTSFIQNVLGKEYPGSHVGPEPTTDRFVAVSYGEEERIIPGNAAATQANKPFGGLEQFGASFLSKFQVSESPAALLESVTFIDTPGVLSGDKQRLGRSYDYARVCSWFAQRSDLILLIFDAHKLDISDELKEVILALRPYEDKIKIVLNKVDQINCQQLMRVYGALMWSLSKIIETPEVVRVYVGSFWNSNHVQESENRMLLDAEQKDLLRTLHDLPRNSGIRKVNEMIKRIKHLRVHALLLSHLKSQMPTLWGKGSKQTKLLSSLHHEFTKVQQANRLPASDFPEFETFKETLSTMDFSDLPMAKEKLMNLLAEALNIDLPKLLGDFLSQTRSPVIGTLDRSDEVHIVECITTVKAGGDNSSYS